MNLKIVTASALAAGLLMTATPALAEHTGDNGTGNNDGFHVGALVSSIAHVKNNDTLFVTANASGTIGGNVNSKDNDNDADDNGTTTVKHPFAGAVELGTVGSVNGDTVTLAPAIALSGSSSASTNIVVNSSTKFKGSATSTASLSAGENVIVVGTTSTTTANTITATFVIALKNIGHFFSHLFVR